MERDFSKVVAKVNEVRQAQIEAFERITTDVEELKRKVGQNEVDYQGVLDDLDVVLDKSEGD